MLSDPKCKRKISGIECGGKHGQWYHGTTATTGTLTLEPDGDPSRGRGPGLYEVYSVPVPCVHDGSVTGTIFVDPGSDTDYIRHDFARALGLTGVPHRCRIKVVDTDFRTIETARYEFELEDRDGIRHRIHALGLDTVTTLPRDPDLSPLEPLLEGIPKEVMERPQGRVDVLLGLHSSILHGRLSKEWGNLRLLQSRFGCGWVLRRCHEFLQFPHDILPATLSAEAQAMSQAIVTSEESHHTFHIASTISSLDRFHELEELGTTPAPVCVRCEGCSDCTFRRQRLSREDQEVVSRIEASMHIDEVTSTISAQYPWKPCIMRMTSNARQAAKVQASIERHMVKVGTFRDYVEEMNKAITEGKVREIGEEEMERWHGPVHYVTTFAVLKADSVSTKTRIVSNSAMKNCNSKLSLNDCMWPGPNALADLLNCLIFWRSVAVAIMMDLRKAYQAIHTCENELHLRRFLFRRDPGDLWQTFGYTRVTFGDVSAGLTLEIAKRKVATAGAHIDPEAAEQVKNNTYVDDSILGGTQEDVNRMRGERIGDSYTGTVPRILQRGGMQIKFMAVTGSDDPMEESQLGGKTLGVNYSIKSDEVWFTLRPCYYSGKVISADLGQELVVLDRADVRALRQGRRPFTRRQALSLVMGVYDPLGLISPALIRGKLLLRRLYSPLVSSGWDVDLPEMEKKLWSTWFEELLAPYKAVFPCSTRPTEAVGKPRIAGTCDSSLEAVCASVYVIWRLKGGKSSSLLMLGKCRVAPLHGMTIPRGELQSLVILHRLLLVVAKAFPERLESASSFTDSMCSVGAVGNTSSPMKPFFANRVSEIHRIRAELAELVDYVPPVQHITGALNTADLGTRGQACLQDLGESSDWQQGPGFLQEPFENWPADRVSLSEAAVPAEELRASQEVMGYPSYHIAAASGQENPVSKSVIQALGQAIDQGTRLGKMLTELATLVLKREKLEVSTRVFARILKAILGQDRELCRAEPSARFLELAATLLVRASSASARQALNMGKLQGLGAFTRGGAVWVSGRVRGERLAELLGTKELPVLLATEELSKSILQKAHRQDHRQSPQDISARSRRSAWIVGATRTAKSVAAKCYWCRSQDKKSAQQLMGGLPSEQTSFLSPFEAASLDLFGPFKVKDPAQGRRSFKCWVIAYMCLATKAVCLLPCPGSSTEVFLTTHRFFTGIYGQPRLIYTDHAPSLVKAGKDTYDWAEIATTVGATGTTWKLTAKACSWRNGLAERIIRSARHTLAVELVRGRLLDFHQFGSTLSVVAAILNSRPLSVRTMPDGDYLAISPWDVLLGRAHRSNKALDQALEVRIGLEDDEYLTNVEEAQAELIQEWRKKWLAQVFGDMVPRSKWKQEHQNIMVGDIGHVRYEQKLGPDNWRIARVATADPDEDGKVRTIVVEFRPRHKADAGKPYKTKKPDKMELAIQRFAVLLPLEEQGKLPQGKDDLGMSITIPETTEMS